jgi:hypothetical protein
VCGCEKCTENVVVGVMSLLTIMSVGGGADCWIREKERAALCRSVDWVICTEGLLSLLNRLELYFGWSEWNDANLVTGLVGS